MPEPYIGTIPGQVKNDAEKNTAPNGLSLFNIKRDQVISDERFGKLSDDRKKEVLGFLFDQHGVDVAKKSGVSDEATIQQMKQMWINDTFQSTIGIPPKKKEESAPDWSGSGTVQKVSWQGKDEGVVPDKPIKGDTTGEVWNQANPRGVADQKVDETLPPQQEATVVNTITPDKSVSDTTKTPDAVIPKEQDINSIHHPDNNVNLVMPDLYAKNNQVQSADNIRIDPRGTVEQKAIVTKQKEQNEIAKQKQIIDLHQKWIDDPYSGAYKDHPEFVLEQPKTLAKDVNEFARKNSELDYKGRREMVQRVTSDAEQALKDKLAAQYPGSPQDLEKEVEEKSKQFTEGRKPSTESMVDLSTPEKTENEANVESSITSILDKISKSDSSLLESSNQLGEELKALQTESDNLIQYNIQTDELDKKYTASEITADEFKKEYFALQNKYGKSLKEYAAKEQAYNDKVAKYNEDIKKLPATINNDAPKQKVLKDALKESYLEWQYWDKRYEQVNADYKGEWPHAKSPADLNIAQSIAQENVTGVNLLRQQKKAEFEAASRMYYNNEGPTKIERKLPYKWDLFKTGLQEGVLSPEAITDKKEDPSQQMVLAAMGTVAQNSGIKFSQKEKNALNTTTGEMVSSGVGAILPELPKLILLDKAAGFIDGAIGLTKIIQGTRLLKNIETGAEISTPLAAAIPTGFKVLSEIKPSALEKTSAVIARGMLKEAVFSGAGGFGLGAITGMDALHLITPKIQFNGRFQVLNPILKGIAGGGFGGTVGMQTGGAVSTAVSAAMNGQPIHEAVSESFGSVDEATKKFIEEFIVNTLTFGTMGAISTSSAKKKSPMGDVSGFAYIDPVYRDKVYRTAQILEKVGDPESAKALYNWLDINKEPIDLSKVKSDELEQQKTLLNNMPIGELRSLMGKHEKALDILNSQAEKPEFDGEVTLTIGEPKFTNQGSVVSIKGEGENPTQYFEVIKRQDNNKGDPTSFEAVNIETGESRIFENKDGKFEFDAPTTYTIGSPLEINQRIRAHNEQLKNIREIIGQKGMYGKDFKIEEAPKEEAKPVDQVVDVNNMIEKPADQVPDAGNMIEVHHGGSVNDIMVASKDDPLFVTEDKSQAQLYANGNEGEVVSFKINDKAITSEEKAYEVINNLGLKSKGEGYDVNELGLYELIDPRFDTSLSNEDIKTVFSELEKMGYGGIRFVDSNLKTLKQDILSVVIFNSELATKKSNPTTEKPQDQKPVEEKPIEPQRTVKAISNRVAVEHAGNEGAKRVTSENKNELEIEGFGTVLTSEFINRLVENGRLPKEALKNRSSQITDEYATKLLNENSDLFPKQFESQQEIKPEVNNEPIKEAPKEEVKKEDVVQNNIRNLEQEKFDKIKASNVEPKIKFTSGNELARIEAKEGKEDLFEKQEKIREEFDALSALIKCLEGL